MNEKPIEKKEQEELVMEKKVYMPPALTMYGKLTQLTAGGSLEKNEPSPQAPDYPIKKP